MAASLVVDLPPEEALDYFQIHQDAGLGTIFLASPTTSSLRLKQIENFSTGFIYVVSRNGVTGEQNQVSKTLGVEVSRIRDLTSAPIAIGFGISNGDQAREVARYADAIVVGSAFVKRIEQNLQNPVLVELAIRNLARDLMRGLDEVYK